MLKVHTLLAIGIAAASSLAYGQCTAPSFTQYVMGPEDYCPSFETGPSFNFTFQPTGVSGTAPLTYYWEYDTTGSGNWSALPNSSSSISINGFSGTGSGGNTSTAHVNMDFATGMQLVFHVRLTISNGCGNSGATSGTGAAICLANFNCDVYGVTYQDYLDFMSAYGSNDPRADFNRDSVIDSFDYLDFMDAYSAGCPGY